MSMNAQEKTLTRDAGLGPGQVARARSTRSARPGLLAAGGVLGALAASACCIAPTCAATGEGVRLTVSPSGIQAVEPSDVVVSFLIPNENELRENVTASFCHFVYFFRSREDGEAWVSEHDGTFLFSLEEAFTVGKKMNTARYKETLGKGLHT